MTISIYKLVCGNCELNDAGMCRIASDKVNNLKLACSHIHISYADIGYELENAPSINLEPLIREAGEIAARDIRRRCEKEKEMDLA